MTVAVVVTLAVVGGILLGVWVVARGPRFLRGTPVHEDEHEEIRDRLAAVESRVGIVRREEPRMTLVKAGETVTDLGLPVSPPSLAADAILRLREVEIRIGYGA